MDHRTALLRHRFLIILTSALVAVLLVSLFNNLTVGEQTAAWAEAVCALVLSLGLIDYLHGRAGRQLPLLILLVNMLIVHILYVTLRGNSLAGAYSLSVMFPVVAGYFLPARRAVAWSAVFAGSLILHALIAQAGVLTSSLTGANLLRILVVYALVVYITMGDRWMTEVFTRSVQQAVQTQTDLATHLRQEVELAKETERVKSLFVSLASHQLRSPLTALRWSLEAFSHAAPQLTPAQRLTLASAQASTMRLINLVTELLNVNRIDSGRLRVVPTPTNLGDLIQSVVTDIQPLATARHIRLEIHIPDTAIILNIDPLLIGQVVINCLSNAIKYSQPEQPVELTLTDGPTEVRCQITDHGIGIPNAEQSKVFQQMFRATNAQRQVASGTGLGLFLAQAIIHLSGGNIGFTSKEKAGSTFWFTIPKQGSQERAGEIGYEKYVPV